MACCRLDRELFLLRRDGRMKGPLVGCLRCSAEGPSGPMPFGRAIPVANRRVATAIVSSPHYSFQEIA